MTSSPLPNRTGAPPAFPELRPEDLPPLLPAEDCPHPDAQALLALYRALPRREQPGHGRWPDWAELDKATLKRWMGWLIVYDVLEGGRDARYRLIGTKLVDQIGLNLTGRRISEAVYSSTPAIMMDQLGRMMAQGTPAWVNFPVRTINGYSSSQNRLWLPFTNRGTDLAVWMLFVCDSEMLVDPYDARRTLPQSVA